MKRWPLGGVGHNGHFRTAKASQQLMGRSILAAALFAGAVQAETVSLVSGDGYAPYADSTLPRGGMISDLVTRAFAEVKLETKIDWQPWARGFYEAKEGKYAATFPYVRTPEREKDFLYSDAIIRIRDRAFINRNNKSLDFTNVSRLAGTMICLPLGWAAPPALAGMVKSGQIKVNKQKDMASCVKMVAAGHTDYFVTDEAQGMTELKASGGLADSVIMADTPLAGLSLHLLASKSQPGSKALLATFNKGLDALKKNGAHDKIVKVHASP